MAFNIRDEPPEEVSQINDINVTPFIDVMLVLLIIFMIAAPLSTVDIKVNLPASNAEQQKRPPEPIYLTIKLDDGLYVNNKAITSSNLERELDVITKNNKESVIFLRADKDTKYENLISLMDELRKASYLQVALVSIE